METFKGVARVIVAFVASLAIVASLCALVLLCIPLFVAFTAFDADESRRVIRNTSHDPFCESIDYVLDFVLRLIPDRPAPKEPT